MNTSTFRAEVKRIMKKRQLNQAELSRMTGIPQANLSRFLSGNEMRTGHTLALLAFITSFTPAAGTAQGHAH